MEEKCDEQQPDMHAVDIGVCSDHDHDCTRSSMSSSMLRACWMRLNSSFS